MITWFEVASVPALFGILVTPYLIYSCSPTLAVEKLKNMGPVTRNECIMIGTMLFALSLQIFG
jgi:di/tricarboxylate transporter